MSRLPNILSINPIIIPATESKIYDSNYIVQLNLYTMDISGINQSLEILLRPYNYNTQSLYPDSTLDNHFIVKDIWSEALRTPLFAQTMLNIVTVTDLLIRESIYKSELELLQDNQTSDRYNIVVSGLNTVQTTLGIL